jgi:hypothetical protein
MIKVQINHSTTTIFPEEPNVQKNRFGSGSEFIGGINAGVNVFACERDAVQFKATGRRITMMINKEHERIDEQKRQEENPTQKSSKKQKTDYPSTEQKIPEVVTPTPTMTVTKKCPNCGQIVEHAESAVCVHKDCEPLLFHATCVNFVADQTWCRRHTPKVNNAVNQ